MTFAPEWVAREFVQALRRGRPRFLAGASNRALLAMQENEAVWWRDACLLYFQTHSRRPFPPGLPAPARTLAEYRAIDEKYVPGI